MAVLTSLNGAFPALGKGPSHTHLSSSHLTEGAGEKKLRLREVQSLCQRKAHGEWKVESSHYPGSTVQEAAESRGWILARLEESGRGPARVSVPAFSSQNE